MNPKLKTELLRVLYAALGAGLVAFLQTILASIGGIQLPETSDMLNAIGALAGSRIK